MISRCWPEELLQRYISWFSGAETLPSDLLAEDFVLRAEPVTAEVSTAEKAKRQLATLFTEPAIVELLLEGEAGCLWLLKKERSHGGAVLRQHMLVLMEQGYEGKCTALTMWRQQKMIEQNEGKINFLAGQLF